MGDHERTLQIEDDDVTMRTKLILFRFGSTFGTIRFDGKFFCNILLSSAPYWDYKPTVMFMLILQVYILAINF